MRLIDRIFKPPTPAEIRQAGLSELMQLWGDDLTPLDHKYRTYVRDGYAGSGPVFSLIAVRMSTFAEVRFGFRDEPNGPVDGKSPALRKLHTPWPGGTTGDLLARIELHASLAGNSYTADEGNRVRQLRPDWVELLMNGDDLIAYVYWPGGKHLGKPPKVYLPDEVAHYAPIPSGDHPVKGMSWLTPVAREVDNDSAMRDYKAAFFKNAATPNLLIKNERTMTEPSKKILREELERRYGSTANAWKTMVLDGGADVEVIGQDFERMAFATLEAQGETRLASAAEVPPVIAGFTKGLDRATYSNYGQAMRRYSDITMRSRWRNVCGSLAVIVQIPAGRELWYDDSGVAFLRQDATDEATIRQTNASTLRTYIESGFTPETSIVAVQTGSLAGLVHTGRTSVQLQEPTDGQTASQPVVEDDDESNEDAE